ncbi:UDP-3-O-(3-hydroxymyristoyl) N-acetylglucosamine deacetylase 2-like protein, partial [Trifolium pratense]
SASKGWLNPPLHFSDEPCRHKILDLIGDLSLFAQFGNQGLPVACIIAYKGGHALHVDLARQLMGIT